VFNLLASLAPVVSPVDYVSMWCKLLVCSVWQHGHWYWCKTDVWFNEYLEKLPNLNYINRKVVTFLSYWKIFLFSQNNVKAQLSLRVRVRSLKQYNFKKRYARAYFENTQNLKYNFIYKMTLDLNSHPGHLELHHDSTYKNIE